MSAEAGSAAARRAARVIQITDTHLFADPAAQLEGVRTDHTLRAVLEHVARNALPADLLLLTGDLVHDESEAGYRRLLGYLQRLCVPVRWVPGNHDDPALMRRVLDAGPVRPGPQLRLGRWQILLLDTTLPGEGGGRLAAAALEALEQRLAAAPSAHHLIAMHHPPVTVGTPHMDAIALADPAALFAVLDRHAGVRGVLWGHFHHEYHAERRGVHLLGTPSTSYQMRLGGAEPEIDALPPGYRHLELAPDGALKTRVVRVPVS